MFYTEDQLAEWRPVQDKYSDLEGRQADLFDERKAVERGTIKNPDRLQQMQSELGTLQGQLSAVQQHLDEMDEDFTRKGLRRLATELGFDPANLRIIKEFNPREFETGGRMWKEGGHYDPRTGFIQVNIARMSGMALAQALAHEAAHARFEVFQTALARERHQLDAWKPAGVDDTRWKLPIRADGEVLPQFREEFRARFPVHAAIEDTWGHAYTSKGVWQKMVEEDGFTDYSKAYWKDAAPGGILGTTTNYLGQTRVVARQERAMDETLAEVASWQLRRRYPGREFGPAPAPRWRKFAAQVNHVAKDSSRP